MLFYFSYIKYFSIFILLILKIPLGALIYRLETRSLGLTNSN